jgi:hypothetical protein
MFATCAHPSCDKRPAALLASKFLCRLCSDHARDCSKFVATELRHIKTPVRTPKQGEYEQYIASVKEAAASTQVQEAPTVVTWATDDIPEPIVNKPVISTEFVTDKGSDCSFDSSSSEQDIHMSSSSSDEDSLSSNTVLHEEEEELASESFASDVSESSEEESVSSDTDKPVMENNSNEMNPSTDSAAISPVTTTVKDNASTAPSKAASSDSEDEAVHVDFSSGWDDVIEVYDDDGNDALYNQYSGLITKNASTKPATPTAPSKASTASVASTKPATSTASTAPVKVNAFDIRTSIKFANQKGWLKDIFNPIASSISIQGDNEYIKKMRFAFLNKILHKHKAFHTIISSIEKENAYYEFLIPFDCYSNHKLDKAERDKFIREHKDLCTITKDKAYTPFTGCGFNIYKTGLALFDFDFKTYTYTYKDGLIVGAPDELKAIKDKTITDGFFNKLFGAIDCSKVLDVISKSNGHHIYCRWDGSLITLTTNTVDKGCRVCIGKSAEEKPFNGEYIEYWCELDIKVPIDTDKSNGICPLPGTVCLNKLGKEATYRLNTRSTESNIDNLWSFKEVNDKIASVYAELDYIAFDKNRFNSLPVAEKANAIMRDPEATEQEKMDAEALAWLNNPCDDEDEDTMHIRDDINGSALIDDNNTIIFTDELIDAIIKGFEGMRVHGHHSVKANSDAHIKAEPSNYALRTAIYRLTLDETVRTKLLEGIYNTAALTEHAKSGWGSSISFNDKDWTTDVQRNALIAITAWIRSNNEAYYNSALANKLYRPGKDYFDDRTYMFTWQEFNENIDACKYISVSTLMNDMAKVLAINTCSSHGKGYFVKEWHRERNLNDEPRYNDFKYVSVDGRYIANALDKTITVPTSAAERERQREGKRKITEFKEVNIAALLKKDIYRKHLASYRGSVLWSNDEYRLSRFKPPAGNYNREIVEYFIKLMKSRVINPKAWEEELASHAYRIQRDGNVFIPKYFVHVDPNGHAGKSFNATAFAQMYGERFSNAGATVANMVDTYNSWIFDLLYVNFEEVQYSNGRGFDIRDKLKQLTTKNASKRDMYKVTETAEHKAIISINTNQTDLYGLVNGDPADLRRLVIIEFKEATEDVINKWESVVDTTIHNNDFGYSLFHYLAYDYKIPEWFKPTDHCTTDIRDEYIIRTKGEKENQISRWLGWLMAKPLNDDDCVANNSLYLLVKTPLKPDDAYFHNNWFLQTKLSKGIGEVAVQSKTALWESFRAFCNNDTKYGQERFYKDMSSVYGFSTHRIRMYGPNSNPIHSFYIPLDKFYELRSKYGGIAQNNADDEDVLDVELLE